jgi:hypothetical protein
MSRPGYLPQQFEAVRDHDEHVLWTGKPALFPFVLRGVPFLMVGLVWGAIDYFGFIRHMPAEMVWFVIPFFALHLFPFYGSILNLARLFLVHGNTYYAFTDKRLLLRSGFWGTDFKAIEYERIEDLEVNVNPVEKMLGVGSICAFTGHTTSKGVRMFDRFVGIQKPYDVFRSIKEASYKRNDDRREYSPTDSDYGFRSRSARETR